MYMHLMSKIGKNRHKRVHPSTWLSFLTELSNNEVAHKYWHPQAMT